MALYPKKNHKEKQDKMQNKRRSFLKKTAYAAPVLIAMGGLTYPKRGNAADLGDHPPSAPASDNGGWSNG